MPAELAPISIPPEAHPAFRRGQLLVLLEQVGALMPIERLGYLEFFAANPFLVMREDTRERTKLLLAGFNPRALAYQAAGERYANRRARLRSDLAALVAWGYATASAQAGQIQCSLTPLGRERAAELTSVYADAYRSSLRLVRREFSRMSDRALAAKVHQWLDTSDFQIDVWDLDLPNQAEGEVDVL